MQQVRDASQVLGDLSILLGARGCLGCFRKYVVTSSTCFGYLRSSEPARDIDDPATGRVDLRRIILCQFGQPS